MLTEILATSPRAAQTVLSFDRARELASCHGSPLLVVSKSKLIDTYWKMREFLPGVEMYYAAKANPDLHILTTLREQGSFVDVCSFGEMEAAQFAGFSPEQMLHTHPCKTEFNLRSCYDAGIRWFVYDNALEAQKIANLTPDVNLLLRMAVSVSSSVVNLSAKFGAAVDDALSVLLAAKSLGLKVRGISFHVGSQCLNPTDYTAALKEIRWVWDAAVKHGFDLEVLDIGGGFPAPYRHDAPTIEEFCGVVAAGINEHFGDLPIRLIAEPGRGMCAESTTLITKVIGKSRRWGMPWYFLDDGLYGSFSGKLFDHTDFPLIYEGMGTRELSSCVVAGPTCDSSDVVSTDQLLPDLEIGELILVPCMGAYTSASASPFNGLPVARSVAID
ncbi:MAG: type III PLP-dependent enzyme [Planctomycetales bacterium]|nr:type III PLP-dependent enzyme [Planctomycetales bacterium]